MAAASGGSVRSHVGYRIVLLSLVTNAKHHSRLGLASSTHILDNSGSYEKIENIIPSDILIKII